MAYKNIVFIKLERRLLNDYRWYTMSDHAQLLYIKLILLAAETYNKIPKSDFQKRQSDISKTPFDSLLYEAVRSKLEPGQFIEALQEIKKNFPKFKSNKHFYYFDEFEHKTNWLPTQQSLSKRPAIAEHSVYIDKDIDKEKDKDKTKAFRPPSLEEIAAYCKERKNTVNPQAFLDHYQANGWVRGKTKIKDWKACVRTWEAKQVPPCSTCGGKGVVERDNGYGGVVRATCDCRKSSSLSSRV